MKYLIIVDYTDGYLSSRNGHKGVSVLFQQKSKIAKSPFKE